MKTDIHPEYKTVTVHCSCGNSFETRSTGDDLRVRRVNATGGRCVIVVVNDAAYGAEVHHFGPDGHPLDLVRLPDRDLAEIARGHGGEAAREYNASKG